VRDELAAIGFVPLASSLYRPPPGLVVRSTLLERLQAVPSDVMCVTAPAGYGKSSFLVQLTAHDPRPTAWVSLTSAEDDPAHLLMYIAAALDDIDPIDPHRVTALLRQAPTVASSAVQQFCAVLAERQRPFVLVLDDVHLVTRREAVDVLSAVLSAVPPGSSVLLGARTSIPLPLGRLRVRKRLVEIGVAELAFDETEAGALFRGLDVDIGPADTARLVERTEGWPVALYLAALAAGRGGSMVDVIANVTGDQRYLVEYLGEELLGGLPDDVASFLMDASCFERFSGSLCDEVLDRHGSSGLLEELRRQNLLIIPLDDRREWYRFHHLMAEFLATEGARRDPARRAAIHLRASEWCDLHGDGDGAVTYAAGAGDLDRMEAMVMRWYGSVANAARLYPTATRWVDLVADHQLLRRPLLTAVAAFSRFSQGQPQAALEWMNRTNESLAADIHPGDAFGPVPPVLLAIVKALIGSLPPSEMLAEATYAYEHVGLGPGHPLSCFARGAAAFMLGDDAEATRRFREGAASTLRYPVPTALCLAHLAVIDAEHGQWGAATTAAHQARDVLGEIALAPYNVLVLAMCALVDTRAGNGDQVDDDRRLCRQHLTQFVGVAPWLNLQTRVALTHVALLRGDRAEATALVQETAAIAADTPGAVGVAHQLDVLRRELALRDRSHAFGPSALTTAELRVLQFLPTHLSVAEIADRLYVSRNTVKSQTISIYRKLGTSSRTGAVEIAAAAGLLHDARHA
jgi:LuxR family maltose regulon positive regulatory protein